jgi:hypothetical protein
MLQPWLRTFFLHLMQGHSPNLSNSTGPSEAQIQLLLQNTLDLVSQSNTTWAQCMYGTLFSAPIIPH